ncbi:unnamed protein product, partial [Ectocarpus sp. 8 AP-2014]
RQGRSSRWQIASSVTWRYISGSRSRRLLMSKARRRKGIVRYYIGVLGVPGEGVPAGRV